MLAVLVGLGLLAPLDERLLALVQLPHTSWLDVGASIVSLGGDATVTAGIALGLVVARWRRGRPDALVPLAIAVTVLVEAACKVLVPEAPPPHERSRAVAILPTLQASFPYAFPSGHVARATFLLVIASVPRWLVAVAVLLMALTRVYLAEHWSADVVGGLLLGLAVAWTARLLGSRQR